MFDVLWLLVQNRGRIVGKDELLQAVWTDSFVEEANITVTIGQLRKALGDSAQSPSYIQTVARRGYRFVAPVKEVREHTEPDSDAAPRINVTDVSVAQKPAVQDGGNGPHVPTHIGPVAETLDSPIAEKRQLPRALPIIILIATLAGAAGAFYIWQNRTRTMASRLTNLRAERLSDTGRTN